MNHGNNNIGYWNTGKMNIGHWNTGNMNIGNMNVGDWNAGDRNAGYMNTTEPPVRLFNRDTDALISEIDFPDFFYFELTEWISAADMTTEEKTDHPLHEITGGYLKVYEYQEAFKASYAKASEEDKAKLFKLPNFDAEIFKEISGIDVNEKATINIGGKNYRVSDIERALNNISEV